MGNPFAHIELNTDDVAKAKKFYKGLFDWKLNDVDGPYTMVDVGTGTGGGMQKKAVNGSPTLWLPYVEVDDVKKTIAKAKKLGAMIQLEYMEIGESGTIGVFLDPTGAPIGVWAKAKKPAASAKKATADTATAKNATAKKATAKKPTAKKKK